MEYFEGNDVIVLRLESLVDDFQCLTRMYGFTNWTMPGGKVANKSRGKLTTKDLTNETRALIAEVYKEDFDLFGYQT